MKKKIVFVYYYMMLGGSTTSLLSLLNTIDYDRYDVDLILYKNEGEYLNDIPKQVNLLPQAFKEYSFILKFLILLFNGSFIKALYYNLKYKKKFGFNNQSLAYAQISLSRKLEKKYDVAIGFIELWSDIYANTCINADKRISWIHVDYEKAHYVPEIDVKNLEKSDRVVCVSEECLKIFKESFPKLKNKSVYIENILSKDYLIKKASKDEMDFNDTFEGLKILTVCRLSIYTKGLDRAVNALKQLKSQGYKAKWYVIGTGVDEMELREQIKAAEMENDFILLGKKINPYPYFKFFDVFALPSRHEGKPMAITEAQILGLPVVVTEYASAKEQINNNVDGIIVPNNDESIYYGIKEILDNQDLLQKFRSNLSNRQFSNEYVINDFYSLIEGFE